MEALANLKTLAEITAYLSAAWFFLWKLRSGFNIATTVFLQRIRRDASTDYLAISAKLTKHGIGSLILHDARVRISFGATVIERELEGYERLSLRADDRDRGRTRVVFKDRNATQPLLILAPEEEATFSTFIEVPDDAVCLVEVAVSGRRTGGGRFGQWRSSAVSLPERSNIA